MKFIDIFNLSTRMFHTRPTRTWLTVLGISVGISAVLFLVSLGYGLQNIILEKIIFNDALLSLSVSPSKDVVSLNKNTLQQFSEIPNVTNVTPVASYQGRINMGDLNSTVQIKGADAPYFGYAGVNADVGLLYGEEEAGHTIISEAILKIFGIEDPQTILGQELDLKLFVASSTEGQQLVDTVDVPTKYIVKGVINDPQNSFIYIPLRELETYLSVDAYEQARVSVASDKDLTPVKDVIISRGFGVQSLSETVEQANKIFKGVQIVLGLFGAVALVVSAIGMFNTMTVTLLERTNEIGVMRAIGAGKRDLKSLFLTESIVIGFLGGVVGILIGIAAGETFNWGINNLAERFGGVRATLFLYPNWFLIVVVSLSAVIGFFSGVFPARRAAKMNPLEALRYK